MKSYIDWNHRALRGRNWVAVDEEGGIYPRVCAFFEKPVERYDTSNNIHLWIPGDGATDCWEMVPDDAIIAPLPEWQDSLTERPINNG